MEGGRGRLCPTLRLGRLEGMRSAYGAKRPLGLLLRLEKIHHPLGRGRRDSRQSEVVLRVRKSRHADEARGHTRRRTAELERPLRSRGSFGKGGIDLLRQISGEPPLKQ